MDVEIIHNYPWVRGATPKEVFNNCTNSTNTSSTLDDYLHAAQMQSTTTMTPTVIFLAIICVLGISGNAMVLYIYYQKFTLNATKCLIMMIACFDLLAAVVVIPAEIALVLQNWMLISVYVCKMKASLSTFTTVGDAIILVAVAFANYRKVCHPFGWQATIRDVKKVNCTTIVLAFFSSIPFYLVYGRMSKPTKECYKIFGSECYIDDSYKNTLLALVTDVGFFSLYIICVFLLLNFYLLIGITALKHNTFHSHDHPNKNINCNIITTLKKSSVDRRQVHSEQLMNSRKRTLCQNPHIRAHILASPGDKYLKQGTGKESQLEASVTMETNSLKISSTNVKMLACPEHHIPRRKKYVSKTRDRKIFQNKQIDPSLIRESNCSIGSKNSNENKTSGQVFQEEGNSSGTAVDGRQVEHSWKLNEIRRSIHVSKRDKSVMLAKKVSDNISGFNSDVTAPSNVSAPSRRRSMNRTIIILILISVTYVTSYLSLILLGFYKNVFPRRYMNLNSTEMSLFNLFFRMHFVNIAANPIIYSFCDSNFRRECKKCLRCATE